MSKSNRDKNLTPGSQSPSLQKCIAGKSEVGLALKDAILSQEALRKSEEKYRAIFNAINEGFSLLDIQFDENGNAFDIIIRDANPAQSRIDGIQAPIGKSVREILP